MTLLEILVAGIILSIVVLAAGTVYIAAVKEFHRVSDESHIQIQAITVFEHMYHNLMGANDVDVSSPNIIIADTDDANLQPKIKYELINKRIKFYYKYGQPDQKDEWLTDDQTIVNYLKFDRPLKKDDGSDMNNYITINLSLQKERMQKTFSTGVVLRGMNP